ncbi:MAG: 23S rRNA (adenine(2503)-C(2))-methyltransferase RlmN [Thermaerobacter sp.]
MSAGSEPVDVIGMERPELRAWVQTLGEPAFRGDQIFAWLHQRRAASFLEMTDLPAAFRARLEETAHITRLPVLRRQVDPKDGTRKYLFQLGDGETVETVLMRYRHGYSVCVSTQVGCRMGCRFCASTLGGRVRNLETAEIVAQVLEVQRDLDAEQGRVGHVVVMGMGEPLENYEAVTRFLRIIHDPRGLGIGWRHMTVSTCGLVPEIRRLADEGLPVTLAVSLHAPNDYVRRQIMPINARYPVAQLMDACRYYLERTGRRISFEYIMLADVNDHPELARELLILLKGLKCHVNLIPYNPVAERPFRTSPPQRIQVFRQVLERGGIPVTVRRSLGRGIDAACGQLRRAAMREKAVHAPAAGPPPGSRSP